MNLSAQKNEIPQLNAMLQKFLHSWAMIVGCNLELDLCFEPDIRNPSRDGIAGYYISKSIWPNFGDLFIGDEGKFEEHADLAAGISTLNVTAPMQVYFTRPVLDVFNRHASSSMFEHKIDYVGVLGGLEFDDPNHYTILSHLGIALRETRLDAFTETLLRPNAGALLVDLQPYLDWFEYAASLSDNIYDIGRREQLIDDLNLVLLYLSKGKSLHFAKMTSLCDVAGSLQPVRNLIQKKAPELVV